MDERQALDGKGLFWEPVRTDDEKIKLIESLAKLEGAKARQEEQRTERERVKRQGVPILPPADPDSIVLEFAMATDTATVQLDYLVDPFLPAKCVVGFYGRGATSKSSFLASIAAHISGWASTLWISVEEPADWIKVRHIASGGAEGTLAIVTAVATKRDGQGRIIGSTFNIYEYLEPSIEKAKAAVARRYSPPRPLRQVVLDTAVGLTIWGKGENANDDGGVKRLLAYLQALAEKHDVTIAIIGHANKGTHDHIADVVMGATAWTNSPRLSFIHATDRREEYSFVVRVAKTNFDTFGATYKTEPVHALYERADGPDSVLCRVVPGPIIWGDADSMELWEEATAKPRDDGGGSFTAVNRRDECHSSARRSRHGHTARAACHPRADRAAAR
jgi:AAA domain